MKKTSFKRPTVDEIRAKQAAKRVKINSKAIKPKKMVKTPVKGYQPPKWFTSIKLGAHGNTPAQKKLWTVIRERYLQEDFEKFNGKCVTCDKHLESWRDGQLAHFKAWAVCNSWFKYERKNLRLSCANCNRLSDGVIGKRFADELVKQYGPDHLDWIEKENLKYRGQKMEVWEIVEMAENLTKSNPQL